MIRLKKIPKPPFLDSDAVKEATKNNRKLIAKGKKAEFPSLWRNEAVRQALDERHYRGKCCFTERRRDIKLERDVEHFRPKAEVTDADHPGYWWLAYDWDNLLIACKVNNSSIKTNHFPLLEGGVRATAEKGVLANEKPVLINPATEDPSIYITFHWEKRGERYFCKPVPTANDLDNRGRDTIRIVGIDREELMGEEERAENGKLLRRLAVEAVAAKEMMTNPAVPANERDVWIEKFTTLKEDIKYETAPERTYAGARRAFFAKFELDECIFQEE